MSKIPAVFGFLIGIGLLALPAVLPAQQSESGFRWPEGKRLAISFSFDDARTSQVDAGLALLEKYGAKVTFVVNPRGVKNRLDGWKKAVAAGHEIGNHTVSHPCTGNYPFSAKNALEDYTLAGIEKEMDEANTEIAQLLGVKPVTFAYPCGQKFVGRGVAVKSYVPSAAKRFLASRGYLDEGANDPQKCDLAQVLGVGSDGLTFEEMQSLAAAASAQHGWLVFAGHEIGTSGRQTTRTDALEAFLRYARDPANGIWLDTVQAVARYIQSHRGGAR